MRLAVAELHEGKLEARREARAAAATEAGGLHDLLDREWVHRERLLQRLVATARLPPVERARFGVAEVLAQDGGFSGVALVGIAHGRQVSGVRYLVSDHFNDARISGTFSGVTFST